MAGRADRPNNSTLPKASLGHKMPTLSVHPLPSPSLHHHPRKGARLQSAPRELDTLGCGFILRQIVSSSVRERELAVSSLGRPKIMERGRGKGQPPPPHRAALWAFTPGLKPLLLYWCQSVNAFRERIIESPDPSPRFCPRSLGWQRMLMLILTPVPPHPTGTLLEAIPRCTH